MTRDDLYPIIDEVLHERSFPYSSAGSAWISYYPGDDAQLDIMELAEALCDAIVERLAGGQP